MNEYLTAQLGLGLAPSVSVPGTVDSWLSSGLLVGRTEKENEICWGVGLQSKQRKMCLPTVPCGQCLGPLDDFTAGFSWKIHYHLSPAHLVFC